MFEKIMSLIKNRDLNELEDLRDQLTELIQSRVENESDRRKHERARVHIPASLEIEREQEFFSQNHKATTRDLAVEGVGFTTKASLIKGDILTITFRLPSSGERKTVDCKVVRVRETRKNSETILDVGAVAVDKKTVMTYRDMLKNRGK